MQKQQMKYKITPLNSIAIGANLYFLADYLLHKESDAASLGLFVIIYGVLIGIGILILDFGIQLIVKEYRKIIPIELLLIGGIVFWIAHTERTKTLLIPDNFGEGNLFIIYGVEDAEKLPLGFFTWNYEVKVPESGILLTSTKFEDDLPQTNVKTYSKIDLDKHEQGLTFGCLYESELNCRDKIYQYRSWIVQKNGCEFSSQKADSQRTQLQNTYCK
ncbi:hypothetical protein SAMN04488541_102561 [Thermoflexibacter ruber]|uniref:Uncharacterized protein n=2 Tax=Thermoflexibacter ruber TaxID=1003 RepID=A0A1I2HRI0_9BACT|nr:hypothetical protein SAMN04488541_102561 [Thermoflexibacter ruber]